MYLTVYKIDFWQTSAGALEAIIHDERRSFQTVDLTLRTFVVTTDHVILQGSNMDLLYHRMQTVSTNIINRA